MSLDPKTELDPRYSSPNADPLPWKDGLAAAVDAELYWLSTVRPDGRPHVTPLIGVWMDDHFHFVTGVREQKAANLAAEPRCAVVTGTPVLGSGTDVVVQGTAVPVVETEALGQLVERFVDKYG